MKVIELRDGWSEDHLTEADRPDPEPGPGEIVVAIKAASLNYRDLLLIHGGYGGQGGSLPLVPLSDGAGEVIQVGDGVSRVAVGDRVCPIFCQDWLSGPPDADKLGSALGGRRDGVLAERMRLSAESVVKVPDHLSDEQAATLPCAGITAWNALVTEGGVTAGDLVVVQGTGGVAIFALQFAKLLGAEVIVLSSSDEKLARASALGADHAINYKSTPDWGKAVKAMTGGRGVDHIVELGGETTLPQSLRAIRIGGRISLIGVLGGGTMSLPLGPIVTQAVRLQAITVGSRDDFEAMNRAIALNDLEPVVDKTFAWTDLRGAMAYMRAGQHFGKVCLSF